MPPKAPPKTSRKPLFGVRYDWEFPQSFPDQMDLGEILCALRNVPADPGVRREDPVTDLIPDAAHQIFGKDSPDNVIISCDYDVDGTSSAAILVTALRAVGRNVMVLVPDRHTSGYGFLFDGVESALLANKKNGFPPPLVVSLDCGSAQLQEISALCAKFDARAVVVDHHLAPGDCVAPANVFELNPARAGLVATHYCTGVLAALIVEAASKLVIGCETLRGLLGGVRCLAGLTSIADCIDLHGPSARWMANYLLHRWESDGPLGLQLLAQSANCPTRMLSSDVAFGLSPSLNAAGRLSHASMIVSLLTTNDAAEADEIIHGLTELNSKRKSLQEAVESQAISQVEEGARFLLAHHTDWHIGVVGPAAGSLSDTFNFPVFLGAPKDNALTFSGRSARGINIHQAFMAAIKDIPDIKGGGHAAALGFSVPLDERGKNALHLLDQNLREIIPPPARETRQLDRFLSATTVSHYNLQQQLLLEPTGQGVPQPMFCVPNVSVVLQPYTRIRNSATGRAIDKNGQSFPVRFFRNPKLARFSSFKGHIVGNLSPERYTRPRTTAAGPVFMVTDFIPIS